MHPYFNLANFVERADQKFHLLEGLRLDRETITRTIEDCLDDMRPEEWNDWSAMEVCSRLLIAAELHDPDFAGIDITGFTNFLYVAFADPSWDGASVSE